ncbi:hypothetical protein [Enterococcus rivorum]
MKLIFERSIEGYENDWIGSSDVPSYNLPNQFVRQQDLKLPTVSQMS